MNGYGVFLCSLRSNTGLSLETLAKIAASSKSTLSRLENGEIPRPFRGATRGLVIQLAHILCASTQETERYLSLAGIDRSLLTEIEEIQLGFTPHVLQGTPEEKQDLERLETMYQQLLSKLEAWEQELGVEDAPPTLKSKAQRYRDNLQEIQKRLDRLYNRSDSLNFPALEAMPAYDVETILDVRRKILQGELQAGQTITPKNIEEEYHISNTSTQTLLLRLAIEGLVKVLPVRERKWPNNAALNEYQVADLNIRHRMFSTRHGGFVSDISKGGNPASERTITIKAQYADAEVASLLNIAEGEKVIYRRTYQYRDEQTIVAISDSYFPYWFTDVLPELEKPESNIYQLMQQVKKNPYWCTETIDVVQASSAERVVFGLSTDDPSALLKIRRITYDEHGTPLEATYLTDRGDIYRLHYSFPLFADTIPEPLRGK